ncbi:MAG: sugar phosphate isomerase/epimerase family protein, partial [bacterium]
MKKIISALHFHWDNIIDCCHTAKINLKLDGIEFSLDKSFNSPHLSKNDYKLLPDLKVKYNLITEGHIWENLAQLGEQAGVDALLYWAEICNQSGITGIVIHGGSSDNHESGLQCTENIIQKVIRVSEKKNIILKLENHYPYEYRNCHELYSEEWEFQAIFNKIDSNNLQFCFDTGHGNMSKNGYELITSLSNRLSHVHLADNHGIDDDHCPYRKGSVPWDDYFSAFKDIKYDKTFCVEFPLFDDIEPFNECIKDID